MAAPRNNQTPARLGRRHFLKSAALGSVAAVAAPVVSAQTGESVDAASVGNQPKVDASLPRPATPHSNQEEATPRDQSLTYSSCGGDSDSGDGATGSSCGCCCRRPALAEPLPTARAA